MRKKKRLKLLMLTIAFSSSLLAQEKYVVVETTYDERIVCQFAENPKLTHENEYVVLTTTRAEIRYRTNEIKKVYVYDSDKTGIDGVVKEQGKMKIQGDALYLQGFSPLEQVGVFTVEGMEIGKYRTDIDGQLCIALSELSKGVNIIKTKNQSFKIIRK